MQYSLPIINEQQGVVLQYVEVHRRSTDEHYYVLHTVKTTTATTTTTMTTTTKCVYHEFGQGGMHDGMMLIVIRFTHTNAGPYIRTLIHEHEWMMYMCVENTTTQFTNRIPINLNWIQTLKQGIDYNYYF